MNRAEARTQLDFVMTGLHSELQARILSVFNAVETEMADGQSETEFKACQGLLMRTRALLRDAWILSEHSDTVEINTPYGEETIPRQLATDDWRARCRYLIDHIDATLGP
jgi:hypothetical protein